MELVHKCAAQPPPPAASPASRRCVCVLRVVACVRVHADAGTGNRYNLIQRCLDIVKSELVRAASVCDGTVSTVRALNERLFV
jgi:hypothetical protein